MNFTFFIPSGNLSNIVQVPHWVQSQRIGFLLIKHSNFVPLSVLLDILNGWENTCGSIRTVIQVCHVLWCKCVLVLHCECVSFFPWPVASGLSHSLPCHNKHSTAVFHLTCTKPIHTLKHSLHIQTFLHLIKQQKRRIFRNMEQWSQRMNKERHLKDSVSCLALLLSHVQAVQPAFCFEK